MSAIHLIVRIYPFFGISLGVVFFDLFRSYRRKGHIIWVAFFTLFIVMCITTLAWIIFRGDLHSDEWIRRA